jgi:hypothetical protein
VFRTCFAAFFSLLTGCAAFAPGPPRDALADEPLHGALAELLCRVEPSCQRIRLYVIDRDFPQAEMFPDGRLLINIGMLTATHSESEIAFVLAHEIAHRRLGHIPAKSIDARAEIEQQADAFALDRLRAAGLQPYAGHRLLVRLLEQSREDAALAPEAPASAGSSDRDVEVAAAIRQRAVQEGLAQLEQRIQTMATLIKSDAELTTSEGDQFWQQQLLPYRSKRESEQRSERAID